MTEGINPPTERLNQLYTYATRLVQGEPGKQLHQQYTHVLDTADAMDTMMVLDHLLQTGQPFERVKATVGKLINAFSHKLLEQTCAPEPGHLLHFLMQENRAVEDIMAGIRHLSKQYFLDKDADKTELKEQFIRLINSLEAYELHYTKKEHVLFPYLEKTVPHYRCLQLMWSFHDDFRRSLKQLNALFTDKQPDDEAVNKELANLSAVVLPIVYREEHIVFPVALKVIPPKAWIALLHACAEIGWCYIDAPVLPDKPIKKQETDNSKLVDLDTGLLTPEQLRLLLDNLPVDITFVDENDEVRYFSGAKHRIFARSKAIIGRTVQNCHPKESVHIVNAIVEAFKAGEKDHADFWIPIRDRFIHIHYFALRDANGTYKGTIEVSQDVTEIRHLQGQKRLLDW
jgi:PAS domain S-box-containing protein